MIRCVVDRLWRVVCGDPLGPGYWWRDPLSS